MTQNDVKAFLAAIEEHNRRLDCFSKTYRFPIRFLDGTLSYVTRDGGTALDGSPTFTLPDGAEPLICWEPDLAPLPSDSVRIVVPDHDLERGPTHPCPHCLQLRGASGKRVWVWVDGDMIGTLMLRSEAEDQ